MAEDAPAEAEKDEGPRYATGFRTHTCGGLRPTDVGEDKKVKLAGFVAEKPDGALILRDTYGTTKVVVADGALPYVQDRFEKVALQAMVQVEGKVAEREDEDEESPAGGVQVQADKIDFLTDAADLPEGVLDGEEVELEKRLEYRQLYLRRKEVQERLKKRADAAFAIREYLCDQGFLELETPHLFWYDKVALDPEQVPVDNCRSYALPCGPVVLNQYVKPGGFDRYFQFQRITRREDDPGPFHQPEFTGIDLNMCYVDVDDFIKVVDGLLAKVFKEVLDYDIETPTRMTHQECIEKYGFDKPDLRFDCPVETGGGSSKCTLPGKADALADAQAAIEGIKVEGAELKVEAAGGDLLITATAKRPEVSGEACGRARNVLGRKLELVDKEKHTALWITDYPYFQVDKEVDEWVPGVVVFTRPVDDEKGLEIIMTKDLDNKHLVRSRAFDLVVDGVEVASAYIGNHNQELQRWIWLNLLQQATEDLVRLRAPIESHRFGVPPHGGMVIGFDRLVARLTDQEAIDEVMTFPKSPECEDPMLGAPATVPEEVAKPLFGEVTETDMNVDKLMAEVLDGDPNKMDLGETEGDEGDE